MVNRALALIRCNYVDIKTLDLDDDYTPYCGLVPDPDPNNPNGWVKARTAPHICISAPTGVGKTRRIFAPAAILHPGPVVSCSLKPDHAKLIFQKRYGGIKGVLDFTGDGGADVWPDGIRNMVSDPTAAINSADEALTVAETMLATAGVGFAGGSASVSSGGGLWDSTASAPLAALLYAAGPKGNGAGMPWVINAAENFGLPDPNEEFPGPPPDESWMTAIELCPHAMLTEPVVSMLAMDPRMRDSVAITARKAIKPWLRLGLSTSAQFEEMDDVTKLDIHTFDLDMLDDPQATICIIAPNRGAVAGVAVALIDSIVRYFQRKAAREILTHRLLLQLGEVCNSCPLPALINYVGAGRGSGIAIQAEVQASSQFDVVFGRQYADALRDVFPGFLLMRGAHERPILEQAANWKGMATRRTEGYEPIGGSRGQSSVFGPEFEWQGLLPRDYKEARMVVRGTVGESLYVPDWQEFVDNIFDPAVRARNARTNGTTSQRRAGKKRR